VANRPHGRYRLWCPVEFTYRGEKIAAQAATGAVGYDISCDRESGRWYGDASWRTTPCPVPSFDELRRHPVVAVDVGDGHLAVTSVCPDGNILGTARTLDLDLTGQSATTRDGRLRAAITVLLTHAHAVGAGAIVIENLDFVDARSQGREKTGNRPSPGRKGRRVRRQIAGIPTAHFRDRLTQMASNAGLAIIVVDPAYTSKWAAQHWLAPMNNHYRQTSGHHAAALVIGRRGLGHRARRRVNTNPPAPAEATRVNNRDTRTTPLTQRAPRKPATPPGSRQPTATKTKRAHTTTARIQATHDRSGPPTRRNSISLSA